ncbi:unnamed protein product [Thlaspi arvense]|uniref:C2H2-type domain-containing protein n=1 Tax=Thlaspi arvense TaxID=13288 RepID=A0AAU9RIL9_THLAR|nr:unnamed protein product [Thlaspi arvense]
MTTTVNTAAEMMNNTAEAEYARAKTSIWWDIENCAVPKGCDAHGIAQKLRSSLMEMNYCGPLSISSYGNTDLIPNSVQQALSSTGVSLNHVPSGRKDASDKKILVDLFLWVVENPAPANIMLISGDGDFSDALHRLRMRRYNILLAHPPQVSASLVASAKTTWLWRSLLASGCPLTHCESSRLLDNGSSSTFDSHIPSQDVSEHVSSRQPVDSGSGSSWFPGDKLKGIYVPKAPNQPSKQETRRKRKSAWFCKVCNVAFKSFEIFTKHLSGKEHAAQWELKHNLELLGEPENMAAAPSECREKDMEMTNKVVEAGDEALVDAKNTEESVQDNGQESMKKCLEKQNKELIETCTRSESSGREFWQDFKDRMGMDGVTPLNADYVFSELSRDFRVPKEMRECFDAILKKLEPTQNEIVIEKSEGLEKESGEPENAPAGQTEHLEEDMNKTKKKKKKKKKEKSTVIEDNAATFFCSFCSVFCDSPAMIESHLNGRKHAATIKKHNEALLDDKQIQEEIIQDNGYLKEMIEELHIQPGKQNKEHRERCASPERSVEEIFLNFEDVLENGECSFTEVNPEFSAPKETREWFDAFFKRLELSQDANVTLEFENIPNQFLEMNTGDLESNSAGATEHPEEYMEKKRKDKVTKDGAEPEAYVCSICSVISDCPIVFESHLMGRRHAARVKKHAEVLFDDKKILEKRLKERDDESEEIPIAEFPEPKEARERLDSMVKRLEVSLEEDTSKQTPGECENASERVEEETKKKNGAAVTETRVCDWCDVKCFSEADFYSHLTGKKHAAAVKKLVPVVKKHVATTVRKQSGTKFIYVKKNGS